jgi:hypothetical protein
MHKNEIKISTLDGEEINIQEMLDLDGNSKDVANLLLLKIKEAQAKNITEDEVVSNYNTYTLSFTDGSVMIEGLTDKNPIYKCQLKDFILALQQIAKN